MSAYEISDWFWIVTDHTPSTEYYSSAARGYVSNTDTAYTGWLAADENRAPGSGSTEDELFDILFVNYPEGLPIGELEDRLNDQVISEKDLIINKHFKVNERGYTGSTATNAGLFMVDRWKSEANGTSLSFGISPSRGVQLNDGGIISQVVEARGGDSFQTQKITVGIESPAADFKVRLSEDDDTNASSYETIAAGDGMQTVTFSSGLSGTFTNEVKLWIWNDSGSAASFNQVSLIIGEGTPPIVPVDIFNERVLCSRYFLKARNLAASGYGNAGQTARVVGTISHPIRMARVPDVNWTFDNGANVTNTSTPFEFGVNDEYITNLSMTLTATGSAYWVAQVELDAEI